MLIVVGVDVVVVVAVVLLLVVVVVEGDGSDARGGRRGADGRQRVWPLT